MTDLAIAHIKEWVIATNSDQPAAANWCASWLDGYQKLRSGGAIMYDGIPIVWNEELPVGKGHQ